MAGLRVEIAIPDQGHDLGPAVGSPMATKECRMDPQQLLLAKLLSFSSLLAATIQYVELVKHRQTARVQSADRAAFEHEGLRGMVRVFLGERTSPPLD